MSKWVAAAAIAAVGADALLRRLPRSLADLDALQHAAKATPTPFDAPAAWAKRDGMHVDLRPDALGALCIPSASGWGSVDLEEVARLP